MTIERKMRLSARKFVVDQNIPLSHDLFPELTKMDQNMYPLVNSLLDQNFGWNWKNGKFYVLVINGTSVIERIIVQYLFLVETGLN